MMFNREQVTANLDGATTKATRLLAEAAALHDLPTVKRLVKHRDALLDNRLDLWPRR